MAGPGGKEVGRVSIRVLPDTSKFGPALQAYLERTERRLRLNLPVSLDQGDVAKTEAQLAALTRDRTINIDVDEAAANIGRLTSVGGGRFRTMAALISAVTLAVGGLAAGLPAMLAVFAAPVGAILAGLDGIKKAAEVLAEPFEHLQDVVSATFEEGLLPAMEDLVGVFSVLENGLSKIADAMSGLFGAFVDEITSTAGLSALFDIFDSLATAFERLEPAIGPFISSLLILAQAGTDAFAKIAPKLASLTTEFENLMLTMQNSGQLQSAMDGLAKVFYFVAFAIGSIVAAGIIALDLFNRMVNFFASLPAKTKAAWSAVTNAISSAWSAITSKVSSSIAAVRSRVASAWAAVRSATTSAWSAVVSTLSGAVNRVGSTIKRIPQLVRSGLSTLGEIGRNAAEAFERGIMTVLERVVAKVQRAIDKIIAKFKEALAINSPSKVMMAIGSSVGEGFSLGMEKSLAAVEDMATRMAMTPIEATTASKMLPPGDLATAGQSLTRADLDYLARRIAALMGIATSDAMAAEAAFAGTMGRMG